MGDFVPSAEGLRVGQIEPIRWKHNHAVVTPNAHVMKMKPSVRIKMLEYCNMMGITKQFQTLLHGSSNEGGRGGDDSSLYLEPGQHDEMVSTHGLNWYIQRPPEVWKSNMHWISPLDESTHEDYLRALSAAGFDEVLEQIGEHFGLDNLVCYHVTFIGVSHCEQGFLHYDVKNTGRRVFNVIFPLLLADETGPELDLEEGNGRLPESKESDDPTVGRLKYQYDVASLMGDAAIHATSAVDYRDTQKTRISATVYVADIRDDNIDDIMDDYTQKYPPQDPDILLEMAGTHWKRGHPNINLPLPLRSDFETYPTLEAYEIAPLTWKRTLQPVSGRAYRIGLPPILRTKLLEYSQQLEIESLINNIRQEARVSLITKSEGQLVELGGLQWYLHPSPKGWKSDMHWISPGNAMTHDAFLDQLFSGGFDRVLSSLGESCALSGLAVYHLSFVAMSHCERGYVHHDFSETNDRAFHILFPLRTVEDSDPEMEFCEEGDDSDNSSSCCQLGGYRSVHDEALVLGDQCRSATGKIDYRKEEKFRLAVSIKVADLSDDNARSLLIDSTQLYPPQNEQGVKLLQSWAGRHWKGSPRKEDEG